MEPVTRATRRANICRPTLVHPHSCKSEADVLGWSARRVMMPPRLVSPRLASPGSCVIILILYRDSRCPADAWYVDHGVLPQEILERSDRAKLRWDELETKKCGACRRDLHQDSFPIAFQNKSQWLKRENGPLCYTCRQAKYFRDNPRPRR